MKTYDRLQSSLLTEFKCRAWPQVRSLWADLMELAEATDERALLASLDRALRRTCTLGRAAGAVGAHHVQSLSQTLESTLKFLLHARPVARPELFQQLQRTMNQLAEALGSIDEQARGDEDDGQPAEMALVESSAD